MKKKWLVGIGMSIVLSIASTVTAFAGTWQQNETGWWYQNDDGSYPTNTWAWIDGNGDGISESYYFNQDGYILKDATTPDGYTVNSDGAWTVDGVVQTQGVSNLGQLPNIDYTLWNKIFDESGYNPYANNPVYLKMKQSVLEEISDTDLNHDGIEFDLSDVVYVNNDYNRAILKYVARRVLSYCETQNPRLNEATYNSRIASNNIFSNEYTPIITVYDNTKERSIYKKPAMNEELCNKLSDAVYTKLTTEGLSNEDVTMDFPDITYSKSQSKRMSSIKLKITDVIADVYGANRVSVGFQSVEIGNGRCYLRIIIFMREND